MFEKELRVVKEKSLMTSIVSERFSMDFLSHQSDKFDDNLWGAVCRYQNLTEEYIETFKHEVDWKSISSCQKLSIYVILSGHASHWVKSANISTCLVNSHHILPRPIQVAL